MLRDDISNAMKDAMKARDEKKVSTLRMVNAAIKNADIEARGQGKDPLDDGAVLGLLQKMIKQRQDIEGVEVALTGERAGDHPMVYTEVKLTYTVRGRKLNRALVERAVSLSDEKYCSATAMFKKPAKVTHEVVLVEV